MFWVPIVLIGCATVVTRLMKLHRASGCLVHGLIGSAAGFVLAPLIGVLVGPSLAYD